MSKTDEVPRETGCRCFAPASDGAAALGYLLHVSMDWHLCRPVALPQGFRSVLTGPMRDHPTA